MDKRLDYKASYVCRANIVLLSCFLENWTELILERLNLPITDEMREFLKAHYLLYFIRAKV